MRMLMRRELTAQRVREYLGYNKCTGDMVWIKPPKQHARMMGRIAGCKREGRGGKAYVWVKFDGRAYALSRLAFLWVKGRWPKHEIDHKNGNSADNRWVNLREATHSQNMRNRRPIAGRNLPMGIRKLPSGKYQARIVFNGERKTIGSFNSLAVAKRAYLSTKTELFGEFA